MSRPFIFVLSFPACLWGTGCPSVSTPEGDGGGADVAQDVPDQPNCEISYAVPTEEHAWFLTADPSSRDVSLSISGYGERVEGVEITTASTSCSNYGSGGLPEESFRFDGSGIRVSLTFTDAGFGFEETPPDASKECSVVLEGTVDACGNATMPVPFLQWHIFSVRAAGEVVVDGTALAVGNMDLSIIPPPERRPCPETIDSLEGVSWSISSSNSFSFVPPQAEDNIYVSAWGESNVVDSLSIYGPYEESPERIPIEPQGCDLYVPEGTIEFDGQTVTLRVGSATAGCLLEFDGPVTECFLLGGFPGPGLSGQTYVLEGTGRARGDGLEQDISTLYLTTN